jgi:ATP-binding cassette, subfamily G (WHITE), member 2
VFSIHQPRYSIFKLFDTAMFMSKGRCIYHGPIEDVIPYFSTQGYECELYNNPADFVLDVLISAGRNPEKMEILANAYVQSEIYRELLESIEHKNTSYRQQNPGDLQYAGEIKAPQSMIKEILYIGKRTMQISARSPTMALSQLGTAVIIALLVGLVFNSLPKTVDPGIQNRVGAIFFIVLSQVFSGLSALEPFIKERVLFIHVSVFS